MSSKVQSSVGKLVKLVNKKVIIFEEKCAVVVHR